MTETPLYQTLINRRSIRRFAPQRLSAQDRESAACIIREIVPLIPQYDLDIHLRDIGDQIDLVSLLGAYGRLVTPPHVLLPVSPNTSLALIDQGYRMQQVVIRLYQRGIGSCYLGTLKNQETIRSHFNLPENTITGALLVYGYPSQSLPGKTFNRVFRSAMGSNRRLPMQDLFFTDTFDNPSRPPEQLRQILEAGRFAPSAVNAQPWRFLLSDRTLFLFATRENKKYSVSGKNYAFFDSGLCMANISLAMQALNIQGRWHLIDGSKNDCPDHPQDLIPLAGLIIEK